MANVIITGAAGFIGSHLIRRRLAKGDRVFAVIGPNTTPHRLEEFGDDITIVRFDLTDRAAIDTLFRETAADGVFHLAGKSRPTHDKQTEYMVRAVTEDLTALTQFVAAAAAAQSPPEFFVRAGSLAEYGAIAPPYRESDKEQPNSVYGSSMLAGAQLIEGLRESTPFRLVNARLALTYGPGQSTAFLVPQLIAKLLAGEPVAIRHPAARRDLIAVDDVVDAMDALTETPIGDRCNINICTGAPVSMREAATLIADALEVDPSLISFGRDEKMGAPTDLWGSPELAAERLHWSAKTPFAAGVRQLVEYEKRKQKASAAS